VAGAVGNVTPLFAVLFLGERLGWVHGDELSVPARRTPAWVGLLGIVVSVAGVIFLLIGGT
jgi:hypothetical protein